MSKRIYPKIVRQLMDSVISVNPTIPEDVVAIMVNYKLATLVGNLRVKADYSLARDPAPINVYGIVLMKSGAGKNSSLDLLDEWYFYPVVDRFKKLYATNKKQYLDKEYSRLCSTFNDEKEIDKEFAKVMSEISSWEVSISRATMEGVEKMASTCFKLGALTLGVEIDEMDKYITSSKELIDALYGSYDNGSWKPKATAGREIQEQVKGVAPNFFGFSTPEAMLLNEKVNEPFVEFLRTGLARRSFFFHEDNDVLPNILSAEDRLDMEEKSSKLRNENKSLRERLLSLVNRDNLNKVIGYSRGAKIKLFEYREISDELATQTKDPIMNSEYRERHFKTAKISAMYAFLDGRDEVNEEDVEYAVSLCNASSESLSRIGIGKSDLEQLYMRVRAEEGYVYVSDMLNYGIYKKNESKKIFEYAKDLESLAEIHGDIFEAIEKDGKFVAVNIKQMITSNPENCIFSASMPRNGKYNHQDGYKKAEIDFHDIPQWITSEEKICYAGVGFRHGNRNNESTEPYSNLIVLDIDEGMSLKYAKEVFSDYYSIITTTRNHQKEKNGITCDRFRVVLLADKYLYTNPDNYRGLMINIQKYYGFTLDTACFDKAHIYYSNPSEIWTGSCIRKFEVSKLIPREDERGIRKQKSLTYEPEDGGVLKAWFEMEVDKYHTTGGITFLTKAFKATKDKLGFTSLADAEDWICELADKIPDKYWDNHNLEAEILVGLRKVWED